MNPQKKKKQKKVLLVKKGLDLDSESEKNIDEYSHEDQCLCEKECLDLGDPDFENIEVGIFILVQLRGNIIVKHYVENVLEFAEKFNILKKDTN